MFKNLKIYISLTLIVSFALASVTVPTANAGLASPLSGEIVLPVHGTMVHLSPTFNPPVLKGIKVHPDNPFRFDFVLDCGDDVNKPTVGYRHACTDQDEPKKLIKYFLAALTTPEKDMWVNLSPYEKDRIVPESFGQTEMGRDLLAQDYILKQITASLVYPEGDIGKEFWKKVYALSANKNIPVNTFNKVWIVPEKAIVYENSEAGTAYVVESSLKVLTEQDYIATSKNSPPIDGSLPAGRQGNDVSHIVHDIVIPQLTKEVNEGKNFAQLRQVYNSLILATWYKKKIKDSILSQFYADKNKIKGTEYQDNTNAKAIYERYLQAFKKGAYNYIKEEQDSISGQMVPKKYFSGGVAFDKAMNVIIEYTPKPPVASDRAMQITVDMTTASQLPDDFLGYASLSSEGFTVIPKTENIKLPDSPIISELLKPWNLDGYKIPRKVVVIGKVETRGLFSNPGVSNVLDMPIKFPSSDLRIPKELEQFRAEIQIIINYEKTINPSYMDYYAYLTIDQRKVLKGTTQRRPGVHVDGVQGIRYKTKLPADHSYLVSDSLPTTFYFQSFDFTGFDLAKANLYHMMEKQAQESNAYQGEPYEIYLMDAFVAHRATVAQRDTARTILRLEFSKKSFDRQGNTRNPLFKYNWKMVPRPIPDFIKELPTDDDQDHAMLNRINKLQQIKKYGGIDFNSNKINLSVRNGGGEIKFDVDSDMLQQLQNIPGFTPVIINIQPMYDLPMFLGIKKNSQPKVV